MKLIKNEEEWITSVNPEEESTYWITTDGVQRGIVETDIGRWDGSCWDTFGNVYAWKSMVFPEPFNI